MPIIFKFLIADTYLEAILYVPILLLATYFSNISGFYGGIFTAYKDTKIMGSTTFAAAIINILINLLFINKFGIYAATFSTLISNVIVYAYRRYKLKKYIKLKEKFNYVFWILLAITLVSYYFNNMISNIIVFIIVLAYCIFTNQRFIKGILNPIISRFKK